jgi:hypothetical protein
LRYTFVSLMSDGDVAVEEIARLVGHASSKVTETVYGQQLRPVVITGAEMMDALLARPANAPHVRTNLAQTPAAVPRKSIKGPVRIRLPMGTPILYSRPFGS